MANMRFVYNGATGTYDFDQNPSEYKVIRRTLEDVQRSADGHLISNFKGDYNYFLLSFDHCGTNQFTQLQTIHSLHKTIEFYPYDELRGTALHYTVKWLGDFTPEFSESWFEGGINLTILLESV